MLSTLLVTGEEEEEHRVDSSIINENRSSAQLFGQEPLFALHHLLWLLADDPTARSDRRKKNGQEAKREERKGEPTREEEKVSQRGRRASQRGEERQMERTHSEEE